MDKSELLTSDCPQGSQDTLPVSDAQKDVSADQPKMSCASKPVVLPEELLHRIFQFVGRDYPMYEDESSKKKETISKMDAKTTSSSSAEAPAAADASAAEASGSEDKDEGEPLRRLLGHPLHSASLVNRQWHRVANAQMWKRVLLDDERVPLFVRGVLESARAAALRAQAEGRLSDEEAGDIVSVADERLAALSAAVCAIEAERIPLSALASDDAGGGLAVDSAEDAAQDAQMTIGVSSEIQQNPQENTQEDPHEDQQETDDDSSWESDQPQTNFATGGSSLHIATVLALLAATNSGNDQSDLQSSSGNESNSGTSANLSRIHALAAIEASRAARAAKPARSLRIGAGSLVSRLQIPSFGRSPQAAAFACDFLPSCVSMLLMHPPHPQTYIPTLRPSLVRAIKPILHRLRSLAIEDADADSWIPLIRAIADNCLLLTHLNLEAIPEKDHFRSSIGLAFLFQALPSLQCLRLDGVPIGSDHFSPYGGDFDIRVLPAFCKNLRAITLDYCDVTMGSFFTIWNECPNIEFLGCAGLSGSQDVRWLVPKPSLRTLRFVDCDLVDGLIEDIAANAPNLDMVRIVYEDSELLKELDTTEDISDTSLFALAKHCKSLRILAISKSRRMSAAGFKAVLTSCPVTVLDFHVTPNSHVGELSDEFFVGIAPFMTNVRVLNLHGQRRISESTLIHIAKSGWLSQLTSICLNQTKISRKFLDVILAGTYTPNLERLSIIDCNNLFANDVLSFLNTIDENIKQCIEGKCQSRILKRLETVYTIHMLPTTSESDPASSKDHSQQPNSSESMAAPSPENAIVDITEGDPDDSDYEDIDSDGQETDSDRSAQPDAFNHKQSHGEYITHRLVDCADAWFTDERLDIFSLWSNAVKSTGNLV